MNYLQVALISVLFYIASAYSSIGGFVISKYTLARPLIGGFLCGLILGDIQKGLEIGVAFQLAYMGTFAVGGAITMDIGTISYPVMAVAIISNLDVGAALAIATPISMLAANRIQVVRFANTIFSNIMKKGIDEYNFTKIKLGHIFLPQLFFFVLSFGLSFAFIVLGAPALQSLIDIMPDKLMQAFNTFSKVLPAVGMAMLLKYNISNKFMFLFFVLGFMMFSSMKMAFIPISIAGLVIAYLYYKADSRPAAAAAAQADTVPVYSDADEEL